MQTEVLLASVSAATDKTSLAKDIGDLVNCSIQVTFTGSNVVGSLKLQASIDNTNYFDIPSSSQAITASVGYLYSISNAGYRYVRAVWTATSGTGNIAVVCTISTYLPLVRQS